MALTETPAIVLRTYKLADADKIVVLLTPEFGLVRGTAKGARRLKSRFGAALEPYTLITAHYYEREGRELVTINGADIIDSSFKLIGSEEVYRGLEYLSEMVIEFIPPREPNALIFRMLRACLETIAQRPQSIELLLRYFEIWLLKLGGFLPDLQKCNDCGKKLGEDERLYFRWGEPVTCQACAHGVGRELPFAVRELIRSALRLAPLSFIDRHQDESNALLPPFKKWSQDLITNILDHDRTRTKAHVR
jgi:DNA repair protein RecO (recombination protein O)